MLRLPLEKKKLGTLFKVSPGKSGLTVHFASQKPLVHCHFAEKRTNKLEFEEKKGRFM
jgi:hypothetical protein